MRTAFTFCALVLIAGCGAGPDGPLKPAPLVVARPAFAKLVKGRPSNEVLVLLGKPELASKTPVCEVWRYRNRTIDPATGKTDSTVQLVFSPNTGRVIAVSY